MLTTPSFVKLCVFHYVKANPVRQSAFERIYKSVKAPLRCQCPFAEIKLAVGRLQNH